MRFASSLRLLAPALCTLLAAVAGCSSRVEVPSPDGLAEAAPVAPPSTVAPVAAPGLSCALASSKDPARTVLAWARGEDVVLVRGDGSSFVAHTFPIPGDATPTVSLEARGDRILAIAFGTSAGTEMSSAALLDRAGKVLWKQTITGDHHVPSYLGDDGAVALGVQWANKTLVITPALAVSSFAGALPLGAPTKPGRVPVITGSDTWGPEAFGWLELQTGKIDPSAFPAATTVVVSAGAGLLYVVESGNGSALLNDGGAVIATFPVSGEYASLGDATDNGWLVVRAEDGVTSSHWIANAIKGIAAPLPMPVDVAAFGMAHYSGPAAADRGEALVPARDAYRGGLFRTTDEGATWKLVGDGFADVFDIHYSARGGTYVIAASAQPGYFPMDPWSPPIAGSPAPQRHGTANEVVRPDDGVLRLLDADALGFALGADGACLAYSIDGDLTAMDVASGKTFDLGHGSSTSPNAVVWLP